MQADLDRQALLNLVGRNYPAIASSLLRPLLNLLSHVAAASAQQRDGA